MADLNGIILVGRITRDPELKKIADDKHVCNFSVANTQYVSSSNRTSFFDCTAFNKNAENIVKYVKKGHRIGINGILAQDVWEYEGQKKSKVKIIVNSIQFLENRAVTKDDGFPMPDDSSYDNL